MNLFARSSGGILSDLGNKMQGMRGRLMAQSFCLAVEGVLMIIFSRQGKISGAIPALVAFSYFVQATEGATFGIVPYICPEGLGGVCAVVGAWGNIGAVCWGMMFKFGYLGKFDKGYEAMGYIIIASAVFSVFMRIKGQNHMFGGRPGGYRDRRKSRSPRPVSLRVAAAAATRRPRRDRRVAATRLHGISVRRPYAGRSLSWGM